ncbi:hypothetical protein N9404_00380 [Candidatus Pelagibacter sp.]|nr:hypothetical protein [Candidatus Pelagibacter sp.]
MDELDTVIFRTDRLGDFIISCPFIKSYKKHFPNNSMTVISSEYNFNFVNSFDFISKTISMKLKDNLFLRLFDLIKIILILRKKEYKDIIVLDGKKRSFFVSFFLKGRKSILLQSKKLSQLTRLLGYQTVMNHEIQSQLINFSFLANILNFNICNKNPNIFKNRKLTNKFDLKKKYIIIHLDEKWFTQHYYSDFTDINPKSFEIENFIKKVFFYTKENCDIILTSGSVKLKNLFEYTSKFEKIATNIFKKKIENNSIIYLHQLSLDDLTFVLCKSTFLICCEGGISHLSNNFKIPTLAFYEKKRYQHTRFWTGHMNKIILYERKKMNDINNDNNLFKTISKNISIS